METWRGLLVKVVRVRVESEWLVVGACTKTDISRANTGSCYAHSLKTAGTYIHVLLHI